jgi:hypothetical protein
MGVIPVPVGIGVRSKELGIAKSSPQSIGKALLRSKGIQKRGDRRKYSRGLHVLSRSD